MSEERAEPAPVFDASRPITIKLRDVSGIKEITVKFPSDEQWTERKRRLQVITRRCENDASETTVSGMEDLDPSLVAAIRVDADGPEISINEAIRIIEILSSASIDNIATEDGCYRISLASDLFPKGAVTVHVLEIPTTDDDVAYKKGIGRSLDLAFGRERFIPNLKSAGTFYKKLCREAVGYAGPVPIIHQTLVVGAAMEQAKAGMGIDDNPDFFSLTSGPNAPQ